jgi:copper chaperone CopZ
MKVTFRVPDMECPNCAMHLEGMEDDIPGINRVNASYKIQLMEVEFDETIVTVNQIVQAATEIGYHPELVSINNS